MWSRFPHVVCRTLRAQALVPIPLVLHLLNGSSSCIFAIGRKDQHGGLRAAICLLDAVIRRLAFHINFIALQRAIVNRCLYLGHLPSLLSALRPKHGRQIGQAVELTFRCLAMAVAHPCEIVAVDLIRHL
jgi:hypothetical protein